MSISCEGLTFVGSRPIFSGFGGAGSGRGRPKNERRILQNLSATVHRGQLTALMGPSGAGKSTLLHCLVSGENYPGFGAEGRIYDQGFGAGAGDGPAAGLRAAFITQDEKEHLLLNLTVKESMMYAARIKNSGTNRGTRVRLNYEEIVRQLLSKLRLDRVKDNLVEKCSGGQKKRLAIGLELVTVPKPNLLLLDEPTSGLDSFVGEEVIRLLRSLAEEDDMAIVATIHQPSFKVFCMFHSVYVLSRAGRFVFAGPPSALKETITKFDEEPFPSDVNPADLVVEIASAVENTSELAAGDPELFERTRDALLNEYRKKCESMTADCSMKAAQERALIPLEDPRRATWVQKQETGLCFHKRGFRFWTLVHLTCRTAIGSIFRQKGLLGIRLLLHVVVALALVTLYSSEIGMDDGCVEVSDGKGKGVDVDTDTSGDSKNWTCFPTKDVQSQGQGHDPSDDLAMKNVKFQFFSLLFLMFASLMPTVLTFPTEIKVFLNEHRNGWYSTTTYYVSKTLVELLTQIWYPFLYVWFLYWYTNQPGTGSEPGDWYEGLPGLMSHRYKEFLAITIMSCYIAQGLGFLIGILCVHSFNSTIIVSSSTLLYLFLFSGFFVKRVSLPAASRWLTNLSFIRFSFESLLVILYGQERCGADTDASGGERSTILDSFDLQDSDLDYNIVWLFAHLILVRLAALLALKVRVDPKLVGRNWFGLRWVWDKMGSGVGMICGRKSRKGAFDSNSNSTFQSTDNNLLAAEDELL